MSARWLEQRISSVSRNLSMARLLVLAALLAGVLPAWAARQKTFPALILRQNLNLHLPTYFRD